MPNGTAHRFGAALVVGAISYNHESNNGQQTLKPIASAGLAAVLGTLPDLIEPANHPNHRQFFHSFGMLGLVGYGAYKLYEWETDNEFDAALKFLGLVACGAYATHLVMDASTPKSLPLV